MISVSIIGAPFRFLMGSVVHKCTLRYRWQDMSHDPLNRATVSHFDALPMSGTVQRTVTGARLREVVHPATGEET